MWFFRKRKRFGTLKERILSYFETLGKSIAMVTLPLPIPIIVCIFWYKVMYKNDIHFDEKLEAIITAAWLPMFGLTYGLFANNVITSVWAEYKSIRAAVKNKDFKTFFLLRDEEVSPLAHILLTVLASVVILGFMGLKYPDPRSAMVLIGGLAYVFALIFVVVEEIDDPCAGIWFIKSIPSKWIEVDVKVWRECNLDIEEKSFEACYDLYEKNLQEDLKIVA